MTTELLHFSHVGSPRSPQFCLLPHGPDYRPCGFGLAVGIRVFRAHVATFNVLSGGTVFHGFRDQAEARRFADSLPGRREPAIPQEVEPYHYNNSYGVVEPWQLIDGEPA